MAIPGSAPRDQRGATSPVSSLFATTDAGRALAALRARPSLAGALGFGALAVAVYLYTSSRDRENLDYFVRLADAFLRGRLGVDEAPSWLNELIPAGNGMWYVPYPPFPAILLMPIVAVFGTAIHQQVVSAVIGGIAVGLAWLLFGRFDLDSRRRALLVAVFGFGTVLWYVAEVGSTWYLAHVIAVAFSLAAIILAFDRRWPLAVGLLLGFATTSRLPVGLSAPFVLAALLAFPGIRDLPALIRSRIAWRTALRFAAGLAIPLGAYALYNVARWGGPIDQGYIRIPGVLEDPIYAEHGILSIHYIPRNLYAIFFRSWNYVDDPPFLQPSWWGLGLFLTTPLLVWLFKARLADRRVAWAVLGVALVAIPIVTHGNVGISQFGYRFSLDVQPLLFVILATVLERGTSRLMWAAAAASIVVSAYAIWAISIGFVAY